MWKILLAYFYRNSIFISIYFLTIFQINFKVQTVMFGIQSICVILLHILYEFDLKYLNPHKLVGNKGIRAQFLCK